MPIPKDGESKEDFMGRCIPQVTTDGTAKTNTQAVAICENIWKDRSYEEPRMAEIKLDYDAAAKRAVLTYPDSKTLALSNVTEEQAKNFHARHAAEFGKRNLSLETSVGMITRGA